MGVPCPALAVRSGVGQMRKVAVLGQYVSIGPVADIEAEFGSHESGISRVINLFVIELNTVSKKELWETR
jgi:hypothetical protein